MRVDRLASFSSSSPMYLWRWPSTEINYHPGSTILCRHSQPNQVKAATSLGSASSSHCTTDLIESIQNILFEMSATEGGDEAVTKGFEGLTIVASEDDNDPNDSPENLVLEDDFKDPMDDMEEGDDEEDFVDYSDEDDEDEDEEDDEDSMAQGEVFSEDDLETDSEDDQDEADDLERSKKFILTLESKDGVLEEAKRHLDPLEDGGKRHVDRMPSADDGKLGQVLGVSQASRRGGRRNAKNEMGSDEPRRGLVRHNTGDSLARASKKPEVPERRRGVVRTSTNDSLQGFDKNKKSSSDGQPSTRTRRGGKRSSAADDSEDSKPSAPGEPERGVLRKDTDNTLAMSTPTTENGGDTENPHLAPAPTRTRRGGRRHRPSAMLKEPLETVADSSTGDESESNNSGPH